MKNIKHSEVTPENIYNNRRSFINSLGLGAGSIAMTALPLINNAKSDENKKLTSYKDITTYKNYYEFSTAKGDPYKNSQNFKTTPCNIPVECQEAQSISLS